MQKQQMKAKQNQESFNKSNTPSMIIQQHHQSTFEESEAFKYADMEVERINDKGNKLSAKK